VVADTNLFGAFMTFETLETSAQMEINAYQIGHPTALTDVKIKQMAQIEKSRVAAMPEFVPQSYSSEERQARQTMCEFVHRSYDQRLITSTQGNFSIRLGDDSFIITPGKVDRKYLATAQIVRIDGEAREVGKLPSASVLLHKRIYEANPDVNSIIDAYPPSIIAFAMTKEVFDSRTIPESYIVLRDVRKVPFYVDFDQLDLKVLTKNNPILLMENRCLIVTGNTPLKAFDRLEVAEYTAKTIIAARSIGSIVSIAPAQVVEIEEAFP
jgi:L-fuculose-phosphate aldolase